jgi:hypothetical protein
MMVDISDILVLGLATWRVTKLVIDEGGPWDAFAKIRHAVGVRFPEDPREEPFGKNVVARALICSWCTSVWIGIAWTAALLIDHDIAIIAAVPFALSSLAIVVDDYVEGFRDE